MQRIVASALGALLTMAQAAGFARSAGAQTAEIPFHVESYSLESGTHDGSGLEVMRPFDAEIRIAGAEWLQVAFEAFDLGRGSWVSIRSLEDGDIQTLDAQSMKATINSPIGVRVLTEMRNENRFMPPGVEKFGFVENLAVFLEGKSAMTISWPPYGRFSAGYLSEEKALAWVPKSKIANKVGYALPPGFATPFHTV